MIQSTMEKNEVRDQWQGIQFGVDIMPIPDVGSLDRIVDQEGKNICRKSIMA